MDAGAVEVKQFVHRPHQALLLSLVTHLSRHCFVARVMLIEAHCIEKHFFLLVIENSCADGAERSNAKN